MKICMSCDAGGHLTEILQLEKVYKNYPHFFMTVNRTDSQEMFKNERIFFVPCINSSIINFIKSLLICKKILSSERPDVLISTGAGSAVPSIIVGKILGIKIVFLESLARTRDLSKTGKLAYYLSDIFLVQWPYLLKKYPKAKFWGSVI